MKTIIEIKNSPYYITLVNSMGDTYTSKSNELRDFLYGCEQVKESDNRHRLPVVDPKKVRRIHEGTEPKKEFGNLEKDMKNIHEALDYEIKTHWLAAYISFSWGQEILGWMIANKVKRKWKRYLWATKNGIK